MICMGSSDFKIFQIKIIAIKKLKMQFLKIRINFKMIIKVKVLIFQIKKKKINQSHF